MDLLVVTGLAAVTALATGLGVLPVYWVRVGDRGLGAMWGLSAGTMGTISVLELLIPSAASDPLPLGLGAVAGVVFVIVAARLVDHGTGGHEHGQRRNDEHRAPSGRPHRRIAGLSSLSLLMVLVFTVHSAPEGVGIGAALRESAARGLIVVIAIAVHNIPEGTAVAVGMRADGFGVWRAFTAAVITSLPQPLLAPLVFVVAVGPWLPAGMGFAGGAMLALVVAEVAPEGWAVHRGGFAAGALMGVTLAIGLHFGLALPNVA